MPNHVYNWLSVSGSPQEVEKFFEKAKASYTLTHLEWDINAEKHLTVTKEHNAEFSFRSFIAPPSQNYEDYKDENGRTVQNWYNWNATNWGTKWDAYEVDADREQGTIHFTTAWSPPMPVIEAITNQHPELTFDFSYEEEQGWGGELTLKAGEILHQKEWDIPNSHAEHLEHDGHAGRCICAWDDDQRQWYKDCPRPESSDTDADTLVLSSTK